MPLTGDMNPLNGKYSGWNLFPLWRRCGIRHRHTKEGCFRLVGYPDWWTNGHKKGTKNSGLKKGKAPIAVSTKENANTTDQKNLTGFGGMATALVYSEEDDGPFSMNTGNQDGSVIGRCTEKKGFDNYMDECDSKWYYNAFLWDGQNDKA
ncbi:hypothetical protein Tco_1088848 [Tanacetum coccineum]